MIFGLLLSLLLAQCQPISQPYLGEERKESGSGDGLVRKVLAHKHWDLGLGVAAHICDSSSKGTDTWIPRDYWPARLA